MYKKAILFFIFSFIFSFAILTSAHSKEQHYVEGILSGDTIILSNGKKVHLAGLEVPEYSRSEKAARQAGEYGLTLEELLDKGRQAKAFLQSLLRTGQEISLVYEAFGSEKTSEAAEDAYVYIDLECRGQGIASKIFHGDDVVHDKPHTKQIFLNGEIIRFGYAKPVGKKTNFGFEHLFEKLHEEAKSKRRGIWSPAEKSIEMAQDHGEENVVQPAEESVRPELETASAKPADGVKAGLGRDFDPEEPDRGKEKIVGLNEPNGELKARITDIRAEKEDLRRKMEALQKKVKELKDENTRLLVEKTEAFDDAASYEKNLAAAKELAGSVKEENQKLLREKEALLKEKKDLEKRVDGLTALKEDFRQANSTLERLTATNSELNDELAALRNGRDGLLNEVRELKEMNAALKAERENLAGDKNHLKAKTALMVKEAQQPLKRQVEELQKERTLLLSQVEELKEKERLLQKNRARLKDEKSRLAERLNASEMEAEELSKKLDSAREEVAGLRDSVNSRQDGVEARARSLEEELEMMKEKNQSLAAARDRLQKRLEKSLLEAEDLKSANQSYQARLEGLEKERTSVARTREEYSQKINELRQQLSNVKKDRQAGLEKIRSEHELQMATLRGRVQSLEEQLEDKEAGYVKVLKEKDALQNELKLSKAPEEKTAEPVSEKPAQTEMDQLAKLPDEPAGPQQEGQEGSPKVMRSYYKDGTLMMETEVVDGRRNGMHRKYYKNGELFEESRFKDDKLDGTQKIYFENGEMLSVTEYKNGFVHGKKIMYSEDGTVIAEGQYRQDVLVNLTWLH